MAARRRHAARVSGDDGVTLILFAVAMIGILIMVALVIDLSNVRDTRQSNKSVADVAATAGMDGLANVDGHPRPWGGVCKALDYLKLNHDDGASITGTFKNGSGTTVTNPCDPTSALYNSECLAGDKSTWAWFSGTANGGKLVIDIQSGYHLPDANFPDDAAAYATDNTSPTTLEDCGQLAVILREVDPAFFGGAVGAGSYQSAIRSVARVTLGARDSAVVALLLLEPTACRALFTNGNNTFVLVKSVNGRPGFIQVNSTGAGCGGGSRVIEGGPNCAALNLCLTNGPSIVAQSSSTAEGVIGDHAVGGPYASFAHSTACPNPAVPTGGCTVGPVPLDHGVVDRSGVDNRYLTRVTQLRSTAQSGLSTAASNSSFFQVPGAGVGNCNNLRNMTISATAPASPLTINTGGLTKIYLSCSFDTGTNSQTIFDSSITDVYVNGTVSVGSGSTLRLDGVDRFYIGGGKATGVSVAGTLWVNGGVVPSNCTVRRATAPLEVTEMVVMSGVVNTSGGSPVIRLCNTFLFLADGTLPTTVGTAPADHNYAGGIDFGSQTLLDWSAPNQTSLQINNDDPLLDHFEDLALWTESGNCANTSSPPTRIGGQGSVTATGVFFLPNACFTISGGGFGASIGADAQFIVRRLEASGTTQLNMAPNPANVVPFPFFEAFRLVR